VSLNVEALETSFDLVPPDEDELGEELSAHLVSVPREQRILAVEFTSPDGRHWDAIGGGATVAAAFICARESCPDEANWDVISWNDLYGD
jgi:hypothetical protein